MCSTTWRSCFGAAAMASSARIRHVSSGCVAGGFGIELPPFSASRVRSERSCACAELTTCRSPRRCGSGVVTIGCSCDSENQMLSCCPPGSKRTWEPRRPLPSSKHSAKPSSSDVARSSCHCTGPDGGIDRWSTWTVSVGPRIHAGRRIFRRCTGALGPTTTYEIYLEGLLCPSGERVSPNSLGPREARYDWADSVSSGWPRRFPGSVTDGTVLSTAQLRPELRHPARFRGMMLL